MLQAVENVIVRQYARIRSIHSPKCIEWATFRSLAIVMGSALLIGMAALVVVIACTLAIGGRIAPWHFFVFPLTVFSTTFLACRARWGRRSYGKTGGAMLAALLLMIAAFAGSSLTVDMSSDGQSAHQAAISLLAHGWNPYHDPSFDHSDAVLSSGYALHDLPRRPQFSNGYIVKNASKGTYYQAAAAEALFGTTSTGKGFNLIALAAAFLLVVAAASLLGVAPGWSLATGLAAALNPIAVNQLLSTYVDGQLGMFLTALIALGAIMAFSEKRLPIIAFGAVMILGINAKLTGFFYAGFLGLLIVACLRYVTGAYRAATAFILASAIGTFLVGYSPLVLNIINDGALFAFLKGNTIWENSFITDHDRLTKLIISLFSETQANPDIPRLKAPFGFTFAELSNYRNISAPDARIGGFGPWMGGAIALSGIVMVLSFAQQLKGRWLLLFATVAVFFSALANPEAWWARFVPQLWLLPIMVAIFGLRQPYSTDVGALTRALLVVILINAGFIAAQSTYVQVSHQIAASKVLNIMAASEEPFDIYVENFYFNELLLQRRGIAYQTVQAKPCNVFFRPVFLRINSCFDTTPSPEMTVVIEKVRQVESELHEKGLDDWLLKNL